MDPAAIVNGASFPPNTAPFHSPEIWHFPPPPLADSSAAGLGLRLPPQFGHAALGGQFGKFTSGPTRDNDPVGLEHGSAAPTPNHRNNNNNNNRKRSDSEEEESAKGVFTSNDNGGANANANGVSDGGDGKRMKGSGNRNENGKVETEASSGKPAEQETTQPPFEPPKQDYIHVRARRGQATDNHSLAERPRREKISERMKILQDLVPGCNKVIGKALVLDEIINYIQSLQRQVEFLSMKLEAVNSRLTPGIEVFPPKDEKKLYCRFLKWLGVADANYDLSAEMEQGRLSELKINVDKDFAGVNKEIRYLKLGVGLIGVVVLFVFLLVGCVLK